MSKILLTQVSLAMLLGLVADSTLSQALAQTEPITENVASDSEVINSSIPSESEFVPVILSEASSDQNLDSDDLDNVSYQASDLLAGMDVAQRPIDLDEFCTNYPYNSRCENYTPESPSEPEAAPEKSGSSANSPWSIGADMSTLGFGATSTRRITPRVNLRGAINGFSLGADVEDTDVSYDVDLTLLNVSTLVDYHPFKKLGFRITGGLVFNDNKLEGSGRPSGAIGDQTFTFNDTVYKLSDVGSVDAEIDFGTPVAPYLGLGWGNAVRPGQRWGFSANLGVMFTGSPSVDITPNTTLTGAALTTLLSNIDAEEQKLEDDLGILSVYPVLSIGVTYHF